MKKFLIGLLSIFMICGGALLSACGGGTPEIKLYDGQGQEIVDMLELEINPADVNGGYILLSTEIVGGSDGRVTPSVSGGVSVVEDGTSGNKTFFKISALPEASEGVVTVFFNADGYSDVSTKVDIELYSVVTSMSKNSDESKNNFLVDGTTYTLTDNGFTSELNDLTEKQMISFVHSQNSRRELSWEIQTKSGEYQAITSDFTVEENYIQEKIDNGKTVYFVKLKATDNYEKGNNVSVELELPVLDALPETIDFYWNNVASEPTETDRVREEGKKVSLISNVSNPGGGNAYYGYAWVGYTGADLVITPVVEKRFVEGKEEVYKPLQKEEYEKELTIIQQASDVAGYTYYAIKTADAENVNQYRISFAVGYANFNLSKQTNPVLLTMKQMVDSVLVSTNGQFQMEGDLTDRTPINIYDNYSFVEGVSSEKGQAFAVEMSPYIPDGSGLYSLYLTCPTGIEGGITADGSCPVIVYHKDSSGNYTELTLVPDGNNWKFDDIAESGQLYILASDKLNKQKTENFKLAFVSNDNSQAVTEIGMTLNKSASQEDFDKLSDGNILLDSANLKSSKEITLILSGQTTINGIVNKPVYAGDNVTFSEFVFVSSDEEANTVTFKFSVTLKDNAWGATSAEKYSIMHENGAIKEFDLNIILPFKSVKVLADEGEDLSNAFTYVENPSDVEGLMLKNSQTAPLLFSMPQVNGRLPKITNLTVSYLDVSAKEDAILYRNLSIDQQIYLIENMVETSNVVTFSHSDDMTSGAIHTNKVGFTYLVLVFEGLGITDAGEIENVSYFRVILIESYNSPEGLQIVPEADGYVELYSLYSVSDEYQELTKHNFEIQFDNPKTTYYQDDVVTITSEIYGENYKEFYSIDDFATTEAGIRFSVTALTTKTYSQISDIIVVRYTIKVDDKVVYDMSTSIQIKIKNAQRVEQVEWLNSDEKGIYFEVEAVGNEKTQHLILQTLPADAKNQAMEVVITDLSGNPNASETFILRDNHQVSLSTIALNLGSAVTEGQSGYVYTLPNDAVYNGNVTYYYYQAKDGGAKIALADIADYAEDEYEIVEDSFAIREIASEYNDVIKYGFFMSNVAEQSKNVAFADIVVKIKVEVADGSATHPLRVFDASGFAKIAERPHLHYLVMNDIDLSEGYERIGDLTGGISGYHKDVTITLNGFNLVHTIKNGAYVKNLTLVGNVTDGNGFVANVNQGDIDNVTINTNGVEASVVDCSENLAGGIVGKNDGVITNSSVLGVSLNASDAGSVLGGIAGVNTGRIDNCRVEFYNLLTGIDGAGKNTYGVNTFTGDSVGAIVGRIEGGSLTNSYAYDYTLSADNNTNRVLKGTTFDPFVAEYVSGSIYKVFAVVGLNSTSATAQRYYLSYYMGPDADGKYTYTSNTDSIGDDGVIRSTDDGFDAEINGGSAYFKDLHQDKALTKADIDSAKVKTVKDENGYYKSIEVDADNGILFLYQIENDNGNLSSAEYNDLVELNTISIAKLFGIDDVSGMIVTSSDKSIVKVNGSSIQTLKTGEVALTISVKQDASINRTINIAVVNAISQLSLQRTDENGRVINVEGKRVNVQKTKSLYVNVLASKSQLILGNSASKFNFVANTYKVIPVVKETETGLTASVVSGAIRIQTTQNSTSSLIEVYPHLFEDETLQNAITIEFTKQFTVNPVDGAISFEVSAEQVPLTPSTTVMVKARIQTTAENDIVYPEVIMGASSTAMTRIVEGNTYTFIDDFGKKLLTATRSEKTIKDSSPYIYEYSITFAVHSDYKAHVSDDILFNVSFKSDSGATSDSFVIKLSKQNITNLDTAMFKISNVLINDGREVYQVSTSTSTLAPGNATILKVNVNPEYAYYDYAEVAYSGADVPNAVTMEAVEAGVSQGTYLSLSASTATTQKINSKLRYIPSKDNTKKKHNLFFKLWMNTTIEKDTRIKVAVSFYKNGEEQPLDVVYTYIDVKYLAEPSVTIDGEEVAYIAKGTQNQVTIQVREDQNIEGLTLAGTDIKGVYLSSLSEPVVDHVKGVKTYTANLTCYVDASTADNNRFYIQASVSRELEGVKESKTAYATAVIVDFKIDEISIYGENEGVLTVWQNAPKLFDVEYSLLPDDADYVITSVDADAINVLKAAKKTFKQNHRYPATNPTGSTGAEYYLNWVKEGQEWTSLSILDRLYVRTSEGDRPWDDEGLDLPFTLRETVDGKFEIIGTRNNVSATEMVLYTYIYAGGIQKVVEREFTVVIETFSNPDLALPIRTAEDFEKLNPALLEANVEIKPQDYILENDIILENHTPFNTSLIRSLDGNGYTIYVKSFNLDKTGDLNLALFDTVTRLTETAENSATETTLKNIRVNYYNGGQIVVDISRHANLNLAGIAINNEGVITNSEVVSFYHLGLAGESLSDNEGTPCLYHNEVKGFNVVYRNGANTTQNETLGDNSGWTSNIAGFVLNNSGSITNSRVGGEEIYLITEVQTNHSTAFAQKIVVDEFNIVGQGDIAGFVLNNSGSIASSFAKRIGINNQSGATQYTTSGFVGDNSENATIITSYVEGVKTPGIREDDESGEIFAHQGSALSSTMGHIAGFIHENNGKIKDSYSNILVSNDTNASKVYLASGFVYENYGTLENCYSASQVKNANYSQMNFSGVDKDGNLRQHGEYINCYYFNIENYVSEAQETINNTIEGQYNTGATLIKNPVVASSFYGFAVADNPTAKHKNGVWIMDTLYGIKLVEADYIAISHRYKYILDDKNESDYYLTQEDGTKYQLYYAYLSVMGESIDTTLGTANNPILIADAQDWQDIAGAGDSSYINEFNRNGKVSGVYRIVKNVDLGTIGDEIISTKMQFTGALYGNGYTINNIALSGTDVREGFGLFASIAKFNSSPAIAVNIDLQVKQVTAGNNAAVGAFAGIANNATLVNIEVAFADASIIEGRSFVGGLVGYAYGDNKIKNITVLNPYILADVYTEDEDGKHYITNDNIKSFRDSVKQDVIYLNSAQSMEYSYAGAVIGFVDNYNGSNVGTAQYQNNENAEYDLNNIRVEGDIYVNAQVVGGAFGFVGANTIANDVGVIFNGGTASKLISTRYFAGGVAGQAFGRLSMVFAQHEQSLQNEIEDNMSKFYSGDTRVERGILDLFDTSKTDMENKQKAIGGIVGYVGGGMLKIAYSKINVTSMSAEYAGGLIGYTETGSAQQYLAKDAVIFMGQEGYNNDSESIGTKYFIQEAYATGDVRATTIAGGLIGAIQGSNSDIDVMAVNAFNYFTNYDYETQSYVEFNKNQFDFSSNFKIHNFVGHFLDGERVETFETRKVTQLTKEENESWGRDDVIELSSTQGVVESDAKIALASGKDLSSYINFLVAQEASSTAVGSGNQEPTASVAKYGEYKFGGQSLYLSRFGEHMLTIGEGENKTYFRQVEDLINFNELAIDKVNTFGEYMLHIYSIAGPDQFVDSTVGHTKTQSAFLNSGIWNTANWDHFVDDLFATIQVKESYDVAYLDVWNANEVFNQMISNPNLTVIVRGLEKEDSKGDVASDYKDIEIYIDEETGLFTVDGVDGSTTGEPFAKIGSGAQGAYSGKIIGGRYPLDREEKIKIISHAGNFIEATDEGFGVTKQTFVYNGLKTLEDKNSDDDGEIITIEKGLFVNNVIKGAKLKGLNLVVNQQVKVTGIEENIGLVASSIQSSTIAGLAITENVDATDTYLLNCADSQAVNVGLVAGVLEQESEDNIMQVSGLSITAGGQLINAGTTKENLNVGAYFGSITKDIEGVVLKQIITPGGISDSVEMNVGAVGSAGTLKIGGFAGTITGVDELRTTGEGDNLNYNISYSVSPVNKLYLGNFTGHLASGTALNLNGSGVSTIKQNITSDIVTKDVGEIPGSAYIGGLIGKHDASPLTIKGFKEFYLEAESNVSRNVRYGGMIGASSSQLLLDNSATGASTTFTGKVCLKDAERSDSYIFAGSMVGATDAVTATDDATLHVKGKFVSKTNFILEGKDVRFGGVIGYVINTSNQKQKVEIGDDSGLIEYTGEVDLTGYLGGAGGIVGVAINDNEGDQTLKITNTSHGGIFRIKGCAGTFYIGGTLGSFQTSDDNSENQINISNNYNYGNTCVEYDNSFTKIFAYNYGGLIGAVGKAHYEIQNNFVASSSHNSRYMTSTIDTDTAHALFGYGDPTDSEGKSATTGSSKIQYNYYSHAVCLLTDDNGIDIGYNTAYTDDRCGYNRELLEGEESIIINKICQALYGNDYKNNDTYKSQCPEGHKLNPKIIADNATTLSAEGNFGGLTYYTLGADVEITNKTFDLKNSAFIGDGFKVTSKGDITPALFVNGTNNTNDYSFISSLVLDAEIGSNTFEVGEGSYAPLAQHLPLNTTIYACNVYGSINIGTKQEDDKYITLKIASLAAEVAGRVADCSTDVDIIHRGGDGSILGLVSALWIDEDDEKEFPIIDQCFTLGSSTTYGGASIYTFATNVDVSKISRCYTATKINWNNYLNLNDTETGEEDDPCDPKIVYTAGDVSYDSDVMNSVTGDSTPTTAEWRQDTDGIAGCMNTDDEFYKSRWVRADEYNYGYPTLDYQYLKMSSYATQSYATHGCGVTETATQTDCGHKGTEQTYDCYVENYTYTRVKNGTQVLGTCSEPAHGEHQYSTDCLDWKEKNTYFYMIPNAGAFATQIAKTLTGNYVLKYDIDLSETTSYKDCGQFVYSRSDGTEWKLSDLIFYGKLDGQFNGKIHTIKGLKDSLFGNIMGTSNDLSHCYIRNLRLTTADNVSINNSGRDAFGLLASYAERSTISNITLNSKIVLTNTKTTDTSIGSLVGKALGVDINTITSSAILDVSDSDMANIEVGGLIGFINTYEDAVNSKITYCSNYGNVSLDLVEEKPDTTTKSRNTSVGGIVGKGHTHIKYCSNAGAVLNGYNSIFPTRIVDTIQTYLLYNMYAGGISGYTTDGIIEYSYNTGVIKAGDKAKTNIGWANAGGIVAAGSANITNCYNEGTVEALGKNAEYGYAVKDDSVVITQQSFQNVVAYGIGPEADNTNISRVEQDKTGRTSVLANGAGLAKNDVLITLDYDSSWWKDYKIDKEFVYKYIASFFESMTLTFEIKYEDTGNAIYNITSASKNFLGQPTALKYTKDYYFKLRIRHFAFLAMWAGIYANDYYYYDDGNVRGNVRQATIEETFIKGINDLPTSDGIVGDTNILNEYYKKTVGKDSYNKLINKQISDDLTNSSNIAAETIVQSTKPKFASETKVMNVGGDQYYLPGNNSLSTFQAGTLSQTVMIDMTSDNNNGYASYSINSVKVGNEDLYYGNVKHENGEITFDVYYPKDLAGQAFSVSIGAKYKTEDIIDTSKLQLYNAGYGIGLGLTSIDTQHKDQWTNCVLKTDDVEYVAYVANNGSDSIYLVYDEALSDFVYIPNATLEDNTQVNTITTNYLLEKNENWSIAYTSKEAQDIDFTHGGSGSVNINIENEVISLVDTINITSGILPGGLTQQHAIALNGHDEAIASTKDYGTTWAGATQVDVLIGKTGELYKYVIGTQDVQCGFTEKGQAYYDNGFADEQCDYYTFTVPSDIIAESDYSVYDANGILVSDIVAVKFDEGRVYVRYNQGIDLTGGYIIVNCEDISASAYHKIGTVIDGVVTWESGYSKNDVTHYRGYDELGYTEINSSNFDDGYYNADATSYIVSNGVEPTVSAKTHSENITIADCGTYNVSLTLQPQLTKTSISYGEVSIDKEATVSYNKISSYSITKSSPSQDGFDMIGVYSLVADSKKADPKNLAAFAYSGSNIHTVNFASGEEKPIASGDELTLTIYQTHKVEVAESDYKILFNNQSYVYSSGEYTVKLSTILKDNGIDTNGYNKDTKFTISLKDDAGNPLKDDAGNLVEVKSILTDYVSIPSTGTIGINDGTSDILTKDVNDMNLNIVEVESGYVYIKNNYFEIDYTGIDDKKETIDIGPTAQVEIDGSISVDISNEVASKDDLPMFKGSNISFENYTQDPNYYDKTENADTNKTTLKVYVKSSKDRDSEPFTLTGQTIFDDFDVTLNNSGSTFEKKTIILTQDVCLGKVDGPSALSVNLIGNGYNISYYGTSLFSKIDNATIKDVNILSEINILQTSNMEISQQSYTTVNKKLTATKGSIQYGFTQLPITTVTWESSIVSVDFDTISSNGTNIAEYLVGGGINFVTLMGHFDNITADCQVPFGNQLKSYFLNEESSEGTLTNVGLYGSLKLGIGDYDNSSSIENVLLNANGITTDSTTSYVSVDSSLYLKNINLLTDESTAVIRNEGILIAGNGNDSFIKKSDTLIYDTYSLDNQKFDGQYLPLTISFAKEKQTGDFGCTRSGVNCEVRDFNYNSRGSKWDVDARTSNAEGLPDEVKTSYSNNTWKLGAENTCREGFRIRRVYTDWNNENGKDFDNIVGKSTPFYIRGYLKQPYWMGLNHNHSFGTNVQLLDESGNYLSKTQIYRGDEKKTEMINTF